jgi:hypothetical protein
MHKCGCTGREQGETFEVDLSLNSCVWWVLPEEMIEPGSERERQKHNEENLASIQISYRYTQMIVRATWNEQAENPRTISS